MATDHSSSQPIRSPLGGDPNKKVITRILIGGGFLALLIVLLLVIFSGSSEDSPEEGASGSDAEAAPNADLIVRDDSRTLDDVPESDVTFVEFLDFECEACAAVYPAVEDLREEYEGQVSFVIRYFPLDGHPNSRQAAHAVEAAARQGELESMYQRMYETQEDWSHNEDPQDEVFRGFAEDLDLDMDQWEEDYYSDEVAERVQADVDDAIELQLQGTPTFFVNGQQLQPENLQDLTDPLDEALEAQ